MCRIIKPQCELIAVHLKLHRVSHRCKFDNCYFGFWDYSHIQEMLAQCALTAYCKYSGTLSYAKFF